MSTISSSNTRLPHVLIGAVVAGIVVFFMNASTFALQSAAIPQSPKNAAIANLKYEIQKVVDRIDTNKTTAKDIEENLSKLISRREAIYKEQDALGISRESFGDVLKNLQGQRIELLIDLAGIDARRDALTAIQDTENNAKSVSSALELLTKVVELSKNKLDHAKKLHADGSISSMDMNAAEIEYLNAKLKLTNQKNSVQVSPRINEELLSVSLDRAEKRARLSKIEQLLKTIIESRNALLENEDVSTSILAAKQKQESLRVQIADLEGQLRILESNLQRVMEAD